MELVILLVNALKKKGYTVATEVPNCYRSTDIAVIDNKGLTWAIECKMSNIKQALRQLMVQVYAADFVYIAMPLKKTREVSLEQIKKRGFGLLYVRENGEVIEKIKPLHNDIYIAYKNKFMTGIYEQAKEEGKFDSLQDFIKSEEQNYELRRGAK